MAGLSLRHLRKSYGSHLIFDDFSLEIADGEFVCLLGPSGSGKTTLIRIVAGLEAVENGEIWIGADEVSGREPRDRHIGMTFQGYALYPHLSVRRNLGYPLKVRGVASAEIERQVADTARLLRISHLLDRHVQQISGGEQQRVAIGRAIVQKPQLYLLDEPISNLDASLRESVRTELRRLQQELRATMIMVTHDQLDALAVADRIAVMHQGRLQQIGTPMALYAEPANLFVAGFIGRLRMNMLPGRLDGEAGVPVVRGDGFALRLPASLARAADASRDVTVGVRPEYLDVLSEPAPDAMAARVLTAQFQGDQVVCAAELGGMVMQAVQTEQRGLEAGASVWLRPRVGHVYLFDTGSGDRLPA